MQRNVLSTPDSKSLEITIDQTELGKGNFGIVYAGQITSTKQQIAVKVSSSYSAEREIAIMKILSLSDTENMVKLYGFMTEKSRLSNKYTIAMTYAPHGSLETWLENPSNLLSPTQQMKIMYGIANGLAYMHSKNIIHGDLKPANILLDNNMQPLLGDFGLSKRISIDNLYIIEGTPLFLAPEILLAFYKLSTGKQTKESDIYSLSLLFWCIVINKKEPYSHIKDENKLIDWVVTQNKRENIPSHCPAIIEDIITCGWSSILSVRPQVKEITTILSTEIPIATKNLSITDASSLSVTSSPDIQHSDDVKSIALDNTIVIPLPDTTIELHESPQSNNKGCFASCFACFFPIINKKTYQQEEDPYQKTKKMNYL